MINIITTLGNRASRIDVAGRSFDENRVDIIVAIRRSHPLMGIVLGDEALMLDYHTFTSFRVKSGNLGFSKGVKFLKYADPLDKKYLASYFQRNADNPYALYNVMSCIRVNRPVANLTQFPPMPIVNRTPSEHKAAVEDLVRQAELGDMICFSMLDDPLSSLVREVDKGQFSHCASYVGGGEMVEATLSGVVVSNVLSTDYPRIALYSLRDCLTPDQRKAVALETRRHASRGDQYSYWGAFLVFLRKKFNLRIGLDIPSPSDLLYSNKFRLIYYM